MSLAGRTLEPVISEAEERFHANAELVARIEANRADPSRLVKRERPKG